MNLQQYSVLLMDMFGVIITEGHIITNGTTKMFPDVGIPEQRAAYYDYEQDTIDGTEFWRRIGSPLSVKESEDRLFSQFRLDPAFESLAAAVHDSHRIVVLSNMPKEWKERVLSLGIGPALFDFVTSGEERAWKPNANVYEIACQRAGARPDQCIFVDDQRRNLATASTLGMATVWVDRPGQANFDSDYEPDFRVNDLQGVRTLLTH